VAQQSGSYVLRRRSRQYITAITRVKEGFTQHEISREMIVANFLHGIASVADDMAGVTAWGFNKEKAVEQFDPTLGSFDAWARGGDFTEIRFYFAETRSSTARSRALG
jgi:hypothetical protein